MTRLFVALALVWSLLLGTLAVVGAAPTDTAADNAAPLSANVCGICDYI